MSEEIVDRAEAQPATPKKAAAKRAGSKPAAARAKARRTKLGEAPALTKEDPHFGHLLTKTNAEVQAEIAAKKQSDPFYGRVEMGRDAEDKRLFDEPADDDFDPADAPLVAIKRQYETPDTSLKLMSDRVTNYFGGTGGYEEVKDRNGKPVKVGSMTVGRIRRSKAVRRTRRAQEEALSQVRDIQENFGDRVAKLKEEAAGLGANVSVTAPGEKLANEGGGTFDMGIHVNRGPLPADR